MTEKDTKILQEFSDWLYDYVWGGDGGDDADRIFNKLQEIRDKEETKKP